MKYSIYINNGKIVRLLDCSNIEQQLSDDESYLEDWFNDSEYYVEDGEAVLMPPKPDQYSVFNYTTKQWVEDERMAILNVFQKRQKLLSSTDWTQLPNGPLTAEKQAAWATYRQALRDVTDQAGYPLNVEWPTQP
jgi:hypothetical protein